MASNAISRGTSVFIHCRVGAHSAGTCTSAYGMMAYGLNPYVAVKSVTERRQVTQVSGSNLVLLNALYH